MRRTVLRNPFMIALITALTSRYAIRDLTLEEPDIEAVVRRIYEEGLP